MTRRFLGVAAALLWVGAAWAGQVSVKWNELGPRITDKKVSLVLPDGTVVQGKVVEVGLTGLQLKISKTSDKKAQPKGVHLVPKQSVSVLQVTEYRKIGRLAFTLGAVAAAAAVVAVGTHDSSITEGPMVVAIPAIGAAGAAGLGVGGYYIGKAVDKRVTEIRIVPGD